MTTYDPDSLFGHGIRISELEKKINIREQKINELFDLIAELRNKLDSWRNEANNIIAKQRTSFQDQLNELKERVETNQIDRINEHILLEEVLRDLGYKLIGWQKEKQTDYDKKCFAESLQYTLKKLDGKKKVEKTDALDSLLHGIDPAFLKTEKKDINDPCKPCEHLDIACWDCEVYPFRDSGGEKEGGNSDVSPAKGKSYGGFLPDSKPPEPKGILPTGDDFMAEHDGEPREDELMILYKIKEHLETKGWVAVKREDLQFLYDNINTEDSSFIEYDEYKRIKEEYDIQ